MSGLAVPLDRTAVLDDLPAVTAPAPVASGTSADIVIETSRQGERYGLTQNGQPVGDVQVGTGARIALPTGAVAERTVFTLAYPDECVECTTDSALLDRVVSGVVDDR